MSIGYILAIALTAAAFIIVRFHLAPPMTSFAIILALGFVQIVVHMRCFLHMSLQRSARSDLMLILFSSLIIALMVGGTLGHPVQSAHADDVMPRIGALPNRKS